MFSSASSFSAFLAVKVPFYKSLFIKEEKIQKDNDKQEQE